MVDNLQYRPDTDQKSNELHQLGREKRALGMQQCPFFQTDIIPKSTNADTSTTHNNG